MINCFPGAKLFDAPYPTVYDRLIGQEPDPKMILVNFNPAKMIFADQVDGRLHGINPRRSELS
jgi:hypothetical protein